MAGKIPTYFFCIFIKWKKSCTGQSYKTVKAQNKKESKLQVVLLPYKQGIRNTLLGLDTNLTKFLLERCPPFQQSCSLIIKDSSISRFPKDPTRSYKNFSKDVTVEVYSCLNDHVQWLKVKILVNINRVQANRAKRAFKKEMETSFFRTIVA